MRAFLLFCLASFAAAAPQGYNYAAMQQPHQQDAPAAATFMKDLQAVMAVQSGNFIGTLPSAERVEKYTPTAPPAASAPASEQQAHYLAPTSAGPNALPTGFAHEATALQFAAQQQQQQQQQLNHQDNSYSQQAVLITKRFYLHSAPEEEEEEVQHKVITVGKPRKNFNVVFIKAPVKSAQKTALKITPAVSEDKTVIYVLAKKHDTADVDAQVYEASTTTAKPEVYFIKYETAEEAAHAQQTIQAQYDSLGGSTHVSNEGVAPVSSVIGSLGAVQQDHEAAVSQETPEVEAVVAQQIASSDANGNVYLPASKLHH